jgi:hypothetical protein
MKIISDVEMESFPFVDDEESGLLKNAGLVQKVQRTAAPFFSTLHNSYIPLFFNIGSSSPSLAHLRIYRYCLKKNIFLLVFRIAHSD